MKITWSIRIHNLQVHIWLIISSFFFFCHLATQCFPCQVHYKHRIVCWVWVRCRILCEFLGFAVAYCRATGQVMMKQHYVVSSLLLFFMFAFFSDLLSALWKERQVTWRTRVLRWQEGEKTELIWQWISDSRFCLFVLSCFALFLSVSNCTTDSFKHAGELSWSSGRNEQWFGTGLFAW